MNSYAVYSQPYYAPPYYPQQQLSQPQPSKSSYASYIIILLAIITSLLICYLYIRRAYQLQYSDKRLKHLVKRKFADYGVLDTSRMSHVNVLSTEYDNDKVRAVVSYRYDGEPLQKSVIYNMKTPCNIPTCISH